MGYPASWRPDHIRPAEFERRAGAGAAKAACSTVPLTGRVEDTINLIGHAARKVAHCAAQLLDCGDTALCRKAGIPLLLETNVKKALDCDWSDAEQKGTAVNKLARQFLSLKRWVARHLASEVGRPPLRGVLDVLHQLTGQDLEPDPKGGGLRIVRGTAQNRRITVEDAQLRHGRKLKSKRIDGYKRHIAADLDSQAMVACAVTPANIEAIWAVPSSRILSSRGACSAVPRHTGPCLDHAEDADEHERVPGANPQRGYTGGLCDLGHLPADEVAGEQEAPDLLSDPLGLLAAQGLLALEHVRLDLVVPERDQSYLGIAGLAPAGTGQAKGLAVVVCVVDTQRGPVDAIERRAAPPGRGRIASCSDRVCCTILDHTHR